MGRLVSKGFDGGHAPTRGFFSEAAQAIESFLSVLEARLGVNPLIRIRMDLDGDGIYETIELDKVISVGNINRVLEYLTNKPRYGSGSFTLRNDDQRWSDFFPKSLTYSVGINPLRYHYKKCVIELGFDSFAKKNLDGWFPLFFGYINAKSENAEDQTVSFTILDEWSRIFNTSLYGTAIAHDFITYDNVNFEDWREVSLGTFYGKHAFLAGEYNNRNNQLMIPMVHNLSPVTISYQFAVPIYRYAKLQVLDFSLIELDVHDNWSPTGTFSTSNIYNQVYIWGWNSDWFADHKAQWLCVPRQFQTGYEQYSHTNLGGGTLAIGFLDNHLPLRGNDYGLHCVDRLGNIHELLWTELLDTTNTSFAWDVRLACTIESNPAIILFDLLKDFIGIDFSYIDASNVHSVYWQDLELDFDDPNYYSFDVSKTYLAAQGVNVCVNIKQATTFQQLVESFCELTRGSLFIDKGKDITITEAIPTRRIHFTIHQPRRVGYNMKTLAEDRLRSPELTRDIMDIKNDISIGQFNYSVTDKISELDIQQVTSSASITAYGNHPYQLLKKASEIIFLYECSYYAAFLANHYLMLYKEPPVKLNYRTDLIGYNWDLKSLVAIKERMNLNLDYSEGTGSVLTGLFEIYGMNFDTRRFELSFDARWSGFLIAPDGDIANKQWGFWDTMYWDEDLITGIEYYYW